MSSDYFHSRLTYSEADDYLAGMNRRCRAGYDQARLVASTIGMLFAKNYTVPVFPWEEEKRQKKTEASVPDEEEMIQLEREALAMERWLNSRNA